ncbi:XRE family transcriptional regulator [Streptococcus uberis]|uniref:XRE family transcriptional regulator n=1 Tax=Streptococcus uberis TaxID=1349 RepID=UPI0027DD8764|nr:XRE family transcriptional regulator [Streptococcus uberis]MCK1254000.1 XRE family transcriptional regulator [Streptococcus uberis]
MTWLSKEAENDIKKEVAITVTTILENFQKPEPRVLGLISMKDLKKELNIEIKTLQRWEKAGLKRYQAPIEDTRKVYYKVSDILAFLGAE